MWGLNVKKRETKWTIRAIKSKINDSNYSTIIIKKLIIVLCVFETTQSMPSNAFCV
ncbi:hypothetical protein HanPSC8_Chr16g0735571 [Helianthus annuus]|nr:hypothetical protein HanPSC8_Chr16g0735571 [Helianthus annuus]